MFGKNYLSDKIDRMEINIHTQNLQFSKELQEIRTQISDLDKINENETSIKERINFLEKKYKELDAGLILQKKAIDILYENQTMIHNFLKRNKPNE